MFLENLFEGFVIESFTSVTRYYSLSLKRLLYAWAGGGRGADFLFSQGTQSLEETLPPGQLNGQLTTLIVEAASGPLAERQSSGRTILLLKQPCSPLTANGCDESCI